MSKAPPKPTTRYQTLAMDGGTFAVAVTPPGAATTTVHGFKTQGDAVAWAEAQRKRAPKASARGTSTADQETQDDGQTRAAGPDRSTTRDG